MSKILINESVVRLALESLEEATPYLPVHRDWHFESIAALRQALDQPAPAQEPVAKYIGECSDGSLVQLYDDVPKGAEFYTAPPAHGITQGQT